MSLLDDARELINRGPGDPEYPADAPCPYCCFLPHQEDCPWLALPRIVAVLEAAERWKQALANTLSDET